MKTLLLLEDNPERIVDFESAVRELGDEWELRLWRDAPTMLIECDDWFDTAAFISLDHDLVPQHEGAPDPGTGLEVASHLAGHLPVCPVLIHSSNTDRSWSMHNELRFGGWQVERMGPIGEGWIRRLWLPKVQEMLAAALPSPPVAKQSDHRERCQRALLSLEGLAIADAVGEMLSYRHRAAASIIREGLPAGPWFRTDDSEMAISIVEVLKRYGHIQQDALAKRFAWRFEKDPDRGYGKMTRMQLREVIEGVPWRHTAASAFGGQGSMGNGGAMRAAPIGAYFADNLPKAAAEAECSAVVTHKHAEGVAGTIAVAIAAAAAFNLRSIALENRAAKLFKHVLDLTPESQVRRGIALAANTPPDLPVDSVAKALGNGSLITAPDTVPFALWCAAAHLDDYVTAISTTISGGGDCDTNAAIVGGIVALSAGVASIPVDWRQSKEPLPITTPK